MDAVKFIEERRRMYTLGFIKHAINDYNTKAETVVAEVEQWSKEHPRKTRQSVFLEQYPDASFDDRGVLRVCPADAYGNKVCPKNGENVRMLCRDCRRNFWLQEVE